MGADNAPGLGSGETRMRVRASVQDCFDDTTGYRLLCWSPKGGTGTTTIAVNLAAAAREICRQVAYVDLDHMWGDGWGWFVEQQQGNRREKKQHAQAQPVGVGVGRRPGMQEWRQGRHMGGLEGFWSWEPVSMQFLSSCRASCCEVASFPRGDTGDDRRAGEKNPDGWCPYVLTVMDLPQARVPEGICVDETLLVVTADRTCVRRAEAVLTAWPEMWGRVRLVVTARAGSTLSIREVGSLLECSVAAAFPEEPALSQWAERCIFAYAWHQGRWARELRSLAKQVGTSAVEACKTGMRRCAR